VRLSISEVLDQAWSLYTRHAGRLIPMAAVVFGFIALVQAVIASSGHTYLVIVSTLVTVVGPIWLQGALVVAVDDLRDGKLDLSVGEIFERVEPKLLRLIAAGFAVGIPVAIGLVLLIVPGLVLLSFWIAVTPAIVLENRGIRDAMRRSWTLVSGDLGRVLAIVAITELFAGVAAFVIRSIFGFLPTFWSVFVGGIVANTLLTPVVVLAWTVVYFDLRLNKG
jgi:hypothetical protein